MKREGEQAGNQTAIGEGLKKGSSVDVQKEPKKSNNIREIRTIRQLARVNLDLESPRIREAMDNLGVSTDEMMKK